jgi:hypothetical protein
MLKDLERFFTQKGWYSGTHPFIMMRLEGGFEAFSGRASETWEYRWVVCILENKELEIPAVLIKGGRFESLDEVCAKAHKELLQKIEDQKNGVVKPETYPSMTDKEPVFVDWNQYSLDDLADYMEKKYMFLSSGEALAVHKLVEFYKNNKNK